MNGIPVRRLIENDKVRLIIVIEIGFIVMTKLELPFDFL